MKPHESSAQAGASSRVVCLSGASIVAFDGREHRWLDRGDLAYCDDRIVHVGRRYTGAVAERIDVSGRILIPGLISAHAHMSAQEGGRLLIDGGRRDFFRSGFLNYLPTHGAGGQSFMRDVDPQASLRFGIASLLRNGVTSVVPFAPGGPDNGDSLVGAARAFGIRLFYSPLVSGGRYHFDSAGRLHRVLDEAAGLAMLGNAAEFLERHHATGDGLVQGVVTIDEFHCAPGRLLPEAHALAQRFGVRLTLHFAEQLMEFIMLMNESGRTPVQHLADLGVLDSRLLLAHALFLAGHQSVPWPHGGDLELLGQAGTSVAHSPVAFARRGLKLESFDRYRDAGINVALGTDAYPMDLFAEMRMASIACKFHENNHEAAPAPSVFEAATLGGARALGRDDLGRLAAGAKADIVVLDAENLQFGPIHDPIRAIVHLATPAQVERVIVDGRTVVAAGRLVGQDEGEIVRAATRSAQKVWQGFAAYHWAGQRVDQVFPPSLLPWDEPEP